MNLYLVPLLLTLAAAPTSQPPGDRRVHFTGNAVLNDEVYLAILDLEPERAINAATARWAEEKLLAFLYRAGYELALVEAAAANGELFVRIDEGRVEKVILRGQGSLKTVRAKLALSLPHNVYNRPFIERQLEYVRQELGIDHDGFELAETMKVEHFGFQLDDLGTLSGYPIIPPRSKYELHIRLPRRPWVTGLGVNAGYSGIDGLRLGADYRNEALIFSEDRWQASTRLGAKLRSRLVDDSTYPALSLATGELTWFSPPWSGKVRPALMLRAEMFSRQRPDLGLETYTHTRIQAALMLSYDFWKLARFTVGLGGEQRHVFDVRDAQNDALPIDPDAQAEADPLVLANLDITFEPDEIRRDRRHELSFFARHYPSGSGFGTSGYKYQKVFELGFHDLWLTSRGDWMWGDVPFFEEEPVGGSYLRGVFGDRYYVEKVLKVGVDFRWSITRDLYKLSVFNDVALFGELDPFDPFDRGNEARKLGTSFGAGFHALISDAFQLDIYYAFGLVPGRPLDRGIAMSLKQAF